MDNEIGKQTRAKKKTDKNEKKGSKELVKLTFVVPLSLKIEFNAQLTYENKKMGPVFRKFMEDYIKKAKLKL